MVFIYLIMSDREAPRVWEKRAIYFQRAGEPQGGGGTLIISAYVGSDPASAHHPPKISGISSTPKEYLKF